MHLAMTALGRALRGDSVRAVTPDTPSDEPALDELAALAARCCNAPSAGVAVLQSGRLTFSSCAGMPALRVPDEWPICAETLRHHGVLIVSDTDGDPRCRSGDEAGDDRPVRFYAGAPLVTPQGEAVGVLCVTDSVPRTLTPEQQDSLLILARQAAAQMALRRRAQQMEQYEALLRTFFDSESQCVTILDLDGSVRLVNQTGLALLDAASLAEVGGRNILDWVGDEWRDPFQRLLDQVARGGAAKLTYQTAGPIRARRWLETHALPLGDETTTVAGVLCITRDVTLQTRVLDELRESEKKFRALFEQATDGIFVTDAQVRILDVNSAACQMTGYTHDELTSMSVEALVPPEDVPRIAAEAERLASGHTLTSQWQILRKDGTPIMIDVTARMADGRIQAFARDVTERAAAEKALRESTSRLQAAVRAGRVGLWDWDLLTNTVAYSSEWKQQFGYEEHEISESVDEWLKRIHPDDAGWMRERVWEFVTGDGRDFEVEFRFRHKNGAYRQVLAHGSKIVDAGGQAVRVLGSNVDVTESRELQAQFLQAQKMESVGRLAGGIAHDFNNLLTVINGMADLAIMSVEEDAPIRSDLHEIRLAGDRAARLTRQLLALSRQQILRPEVLALSDILAKMDNMLRRLLGEDVTLVMQPLEGAATVKADPGQIEQVVMNLAINARDAMPDGGTLTITTRVVELDAAFAAGHPSVVPGPHVLLEVHDTGAGMDEATRDRIFEPFFTTKAPGKGTGLGLPTVYGIVKQSGGSVWVASTPGSGTTFSIYLPQANGTPAAARAAIAGEPAHGTETILLVEDERPLREFTRRILQAAGYTVMQAGNGDEALQAMENGDTVHLLITDVVMPGMNGRELSTRATALRPDLRVLYMSGYTDDAILRHGVLDDEARFLMKPFTQAELKGKVREVLDG